MCYGVTLKFKRWVFDIECDSEYYQNTRERLQRIVTLICKEKKMKKLFCWMAVILLSSGGLAQAQEKNELGVTFDVTYSSRWMSRGVPVWGKDGGFFETMSLDLWGTGFGFGVIHRSATGGGNAKKQRIDYTLSYSNSAFDSTLYETKYKVAYMYKNWYNKMTNKDIEMCVFQYSLPKILGSTGLVPYGITTYDYPAKSDHGYGDHWAGWVHRFGLGYDLDVFDLPSPLHLSSDIAYTDGFRGADHDWSFTTFGISTKLKLSENITFVPAIYQQISMDDSVCDHDVTYCMLSMKYEF